VDNELYWSGVNIHGYCLVPPKDNMGELLLLMYCVGCRVVKDFVLTRTLTNLFNRKTAFIEFGTNCMKCNRKSRIKMTWNDTPSLNNLYQN
jgi:hypothetical protein